MGRQQSVYMTTKQLEIIEELTKRTGRPASEIIRVLMRLGTRSMDQIADKAKLIHDELTEIYREEITDGKPA
jgi:Arc/MetJ-type ribon-helix-helix transcriptional regulator